VTVKPVKKEKTEAKDGREKGESCLSRNWNEKRIQLRKSLPGKKSAGPHSGELKPGRVTGNLSRDQYTSSESKREKRE